MRRRSRLWKTAAAFFFSCGICSFWNTRRRQTLSRFQASILKVQTEQAEYRALQYQCFEEYGQCICGADNKRQCEVLAIKRTARVRVLVDKFTWLTQRPRGQFTCPQTTCEIELSGDSNTHNSTIPLPYAYDAWLSAAPSFYAAPVPELQQHQHAYFVLLESCSLYPEYCSRTWLEEQGFTRVLTMQSVENYPTTPLSFLSWELTTSLHPPLNVEQKRKAIAVFVSNCDNTNTKRFERLNFFMNSSAEVHSYGGCLHTHDVETEFPRCNSLERRDAFDDFQKLCVFQHYRFALVIENFESPGYISEKMFHALLAGTVPIYFGHVDNEKFLPSQDAAIFLHDDVNADKHVEQINALMEDDAAYRRMLAWKNTDQTQLPSPFRSIHRYSIGNLACLVCDTVASAFPILKANTRPMTEIASMNVSLFVTWVGVYTVLKNTSLIFLTFLEELDVELEPGNVQYTGTRSRQLHDEINIEFQLLDSLPRPCAFIRKMHNYIISCPTLRVDDPATGVLHASSPDSTVNQLAIPLVPESLAKHRRVETAICSATYFGEVDDSARKRLIEWISHHSNMGFELIMLYARNVDELKFLETQFDGLVELVAFPPLSRNPENINRYRGYYDQSYALNECLYRLKNRATYISFQDVDEFFVLESDNYGGLSSFLYKHFQVGDEDIAGLHFNDTIFVSTLLDTTLGYDDSKLLLEQFDNPVDTYDMLKMIISTALVEEVTNHLVPGKMVMVDGRVAQYRHLVNAFSLRYEANQTLVRSRQPLRPDLLHKLRVQVGNHF